MELKEMQKQLLEVIKKINNKCNVEHNPDSIFLHLCEEVGEVARELSKKQKNWREEFSRERLGDELADVISQALVIAKDNDIDIEETWKNKLEKVKKRFEIGER